MVGLPILAAINPVCLNMFGFWWPAIRLMPLYPGLFGLTAAPKPLVLQAMATAFPIGADSTIAARCFGDFKALLFMPHIAAKAVPGFAFDLPR